MNGEQNVERSWFVYRGVNACLQICDMYDELSI